MTFRTPGRGFSCAIIFLLLFSFTSFAQSSRYEVTGKVTDDAGTPLEYATISFSNVEDPSNLTGGITTGSGEFAIEVPEGTYDITIEFISFEPRVYRNRTISSDLSLGNIVLGMAASDLDEVVVVAETTQVDVRLDKKIYNIGKDLTTQGGTVADALNNVPSVSVDVEGGISLRGNENVRILINGKPSAMAGFGGTDVLAQLPSDAIERVEVITSPSARYDAEGTAGILNIILRQEETLGFNGSLTGRIGHPDNAGISANVNYRTMKFNLFNTTGFRYFDAPGNSYSNTLWYERSGEEGLIPEYRIIEDREVERLNRGFNTNFGMEYFLTDRSSITATAFFRYGEDEDLTTNKSDRYNDDGSHVRSITRTESQSEEDNSYQFSLNYINKFNDDGHELTADIQIERDEEVQNSFVNEDVHFNNMPDPVVFSPERIYTEETQNEYLIQTDYVRPFGEGSQFEAGYRGNFENTLTDYQLEQEGANGEFIRNPNLSNIFDYTENVNSLYTQYGTKLGDFSFLLGLRLENTQLKGKIESDLSEAELQQEFGIPVDTDFDNNYFGLFPTVNLIYELNEMENVTIGYNRRINRPRGWFINPFPSRESSTQVFQGNPNLEPAFSNAFDIGYLKRWNKLTLTSSVYYQHETDAFERITQATDQMVGGEPVTRTIPVNLATNQRYGGELGILYNPISWLRLNGSFNFFEFNREGEFNNIDYGAKSTSWFARFSSKVTLPADIQWQANAFYRGATQDVQGERDGLLSVDMALAKDILNDNATLSLNVSDLFNSRKMESFTSTEFFERESNMQWRQRSVVLSLTYRFNQQKMEQDRRRRAMEDNENGDEEMGEGF